MDYNFYLNNTINIVNNIQLWINSICDTNNLIIPKITYNIYDNIDEYSISIDIKSDNLQQPQFVKFMIEKNALNIIIESSNNLFDYYFGAEYNKYRSDEPIYYKLDISDKIVLYYSISHDPSRINKNLNDDINKISKEQIDIIYSNNASWDMIDVDRSLDNEKIKEYLNSIDNTKIKDITNIIIQNTKYITFNELKETLIGQIERLPDNINLYFGVEYNKIGSENWLIILLWPYLKNKVHKIINTYKDICDTYPIVIIDDAMYSGQQMLRTIDLLNNHYNLYSEEYEEIHNTYIGKNVIINKILTSPFILLVGYTSDISLVKIQNYRDTANVNISIYTENIVNNIFTYLGNYITPGNGIEIGEFMRTYFNMMDINVPIYFDHKIAGIHSSFPEIYTKLVKEQPSRYKIKELLDILKYLGINTPYDK